MTNPEFPSVMWAGPASAGRSRAGLGPYRYLTWHCTSNPTSNAWGEAAFARNRDDGVGTHVVADVNVCLQTQVTSLSVGHVGSGIGNRFGLAIEQCGVDSDPAEHWMPIIDNVVPWARLVMAKYGIANRWLTIAEMNDGHSTGHITHDMARIAWGHTDHDDPGPWFPKSYVVSAIAGHQPPPQTGDEDMSTLIRFSGHAAVFRSNGVHAKWVKTEAELNDQITLQRDGTYGTDPVHSGPGWEFGGAVRVVGDKDLIGEVVGDVPDGWLPPPPPPVV
jgi:hypothetical protein